MDRDLFIRLGGCPHCWPEDQADEPSAPRPYHPLEDRPQAPHPGLVVSREDDDESELVRRAAYGDR
jgi:hypothetical protein